MKDLPACFPHAYPPLPACLRPYREGGRQEASRSPLYRAGTAHEGQLPHRAGTRRKD
jgi:hypothetical protein